MDGILEVLVGGFIARVIGAQFRYRFLKLFKSDVSLKKIRNDDKEHSWVQDFYNVVVGLMVILGILYIIYCFSML